MSHRDEGLPFESGDELELHASLPGHPSRLQSVVDTVTIGDTDTYNPATQCLEDVSHDDVTVTFNSLPTVNSDTVNIECSVDTGFDEPVQPQLHPDTGAGRGGISDDWDFENGWKFFDTVSPGSSIDEDYDVPAGTFAPADTPALGASVEVRAYPESEWGLDNYVASDCAPISGVRFTEQPMAESDTVCIRYLYPDTFEQTGQIRLQVNGDEIDTVDSIYPGTMDAHTFSIDTIQEIEVEDEITLTLGPEAGGSFDSAQQTVLPADAGAVSFETIPAALDQHITLDYHLDADFDTERFAALRLYTEQTSAWGVHLDRVEPGSDTVETIDINPDEVCVPFQPGTEVTVKLVYWDDPYGTVPVDTVSAVVGTNRDDPEQANLNLQMVKIDDVAPEDTFPVAVTIEEINGLVAEDVTATLVLNSPTDENIYDETVGIGDFDDETTATFGEDDGTPEVGPFEVEGEYEATVQVDAANADTVDTTELFTVTEEPDEEPSLGDYTDEEGKAEASDVFDAIEDWRDGEIDPDLVFDVIEAWRSS